MSVDEFSALATMRDRLASSEFAGLRQAEPGEVYSGDDAAVLWAPSGQLLLAVDLVVENIHFDLALGSVADAAWKAVAVNVSDIAAMGGEPLHIVAGVSAPSQTDLGQITTGLASAAASYGVGLVGGDLTSGERLVISVTVTGSPGAAGAVLRSGASPGDLVYVTGPLGRSAAGLAMLRAAGPGPASGTPASVAADLVEAYLRPIARVAEGRLAARLGATAMIDVSDGLASDAGHIASESGVGLRLSMVPVAEGSEIGHALGGGEDYELVFTVPPGVEVVAAFAQAGLRTPLLIGEIVSDPSERSVGGNPLPQVGWSHSF